MEVDLLNGGILNLGETDNNSLGGTFTQEANGSLALKLKTASSYTESIFLVKNANLDGTLNVSFANNFSLSEGDTIELLDVNRPTPIHMGSRQQVILPPTLSVARGLSRPIESGQENQGGKWMVRAQQRCAIHQEQSYPLESGS